MANVPKAIADLPVASAMGDDDLLVVSQNATTSSIKGELIKGYAQNAVASQVTAAQTAANQAGQSATQAEAARQGAAAAQTAAESAQDAAETARDQSVAAAGTIGDSVEQAQDAASQASSAKDAAVAAQTAAETAKTAAETASGQAQTAATQAAGSATAAQTAATQAGDAKADAETARNEAETSASSAANSASDAESAAAEAEQAKTHIENMDMEGETLPAGSSVTVTKTTSPEGDLLFLIGVPQGIQGDRGETGETGATGPQGVSVTNATVNEDGDLVITLSAGDPINAGSVIGPQGIQGEVGPTGASVDRIERTSGAGAPGTTDTYTVYLTDGKTGGTFQVYNGSNGTGSGDFMADGSVPMTGALQMEGHAVTGMADGTDPTDGATVGQLAGKLDSPDGGTAGQVLTKTANGSAWENAPSGLPEGGTEGQVIKKTADGAEWDNADWLPLNGGTMSGDIAMGGHKITNLGAPTNANDAVRQADLKVVSDEVDGIISGTTGITLAPATTTKIGGVIVGDGIEVEADGTISVTPGLTQSEADERYLQLTGGEVNGEVTVNDWFYVKSGAISVNPSPLMNTAGINSDEIATNKIYRRGSAGYPNLSFSSNNIRLYNNKGNGASVSVGPTGDLNGSQVKISGDYVYISNLVDPTDPDDAANKAYVDSKAPLPPVPITLTTSSWSSNTQTVTVSGVSATETAQLITPTPAIASQSAYYEAGIMCTGQAANSLTFTCQTVPTRNLTVYVVIQPLS